MSAPGTVQVAARTFSTWSSTMRLVLADGRNIEAAEADLRALLDRVERAVSRFRPDSELSRANARAGRPTPVSRLTAKLVAAALRAARDTDGLVDPTVGRCLEQLGYDRDIAAVRDTDGPAVQAIAPLRGWRHVRLDRGLGALTVPAHTVLDLGATAKAYTADLAAAQLHARYRTDVLVELGGDLAVAGGRAWPVTVAERESTPGHLVVLSAGGLTTSTTVLRRWRRGGVEQHHIVDPRTGAPAGGPWRTVTVHGASAYAANVASTAAIVLGTAADRWLAGRGLAARLVGQDGSIRTVGGWPSDAPATDGQVAA